MLSSAWESFAIVDLAFPKSMTVLGWTNSSFSIPANPGFILRLHTMTVLALSTSRIGIP